MHNRPLAKVTLNLYEGDMARVKAIAGAAGASVVIRNILAAWLEKIENELPSKQESLTEAGIEVDV